MFEKNIPFALNIAASAADPANPVASAQNTPTDYQVPATPNFVVSAFNESWGSPQVVEATVKRSLGPVTVRYRVNGGAWRRTTTSEFKGGAQVRRRTRPLLRQGPRHRESRQAGRPRRGAVPSRW